MRKNSFLSPVTDLFIALALVFFILFAAKPESDKASGFPRTPVEEKAATGEHPSRAVNNQRLRHGKDAAFKFGGAQLTLETALHARQAIFNRIHMIHRSWRGVKSLNESELHFRIVTNSDPLLGDNHYGNWNRSSERALAILQAGFLSGAAFRKDLAETVSRALAADRNEATGPDCQQALERWESEILAPGEPLRWLYAYECKEKSFAPRLTAYVCLWRGGPGARHAALFRRQKFRRTELLLTSNDGLDPMLIRFLRYREKLPYGPVAYDILYQSMDRTWARAARDAAPLVLDRDGLFLENALSQNPPTHPGDATPAPWDDALYPYMPFFLIANKGSFDSFSPQEKDITELLDVLFHRMLDNLKQAPGLARWRVPGRIHRLLGLEALSRTLPEPEADESLDHYFKRNQRAIRFLISCQLNRGYDIFDVCEESLYGKPTFHIRAVLKQLDLMSQAMADDGRPLFMAPRITSNTAARLGIYNAISAKYEGNAAHLDRYVPYLPLMPSEKRQDRILCADDQAPGQ